MTGGWAQTIVPDVNGATQRNGTEIEPGDLDEAIQTALVIGDEASTDDILGTGFEQIASFRQGVLNGLEACTSQIGGGHRDDARRAGRWTGARSPGHRHEQLPPGR